MSIPTRFKKSMSSSIHSRYTLTSWNNTVNYVLKTIQKTKNSLINLFLSITLFIAFVESQRMYNLANKPLVYYRNTGLLGGSLSRVRGFVQIEHFIPNYTKRRKYNQTYERGILILFILSYIWCSRSFFTRGKSTLSRFISTLSYNLKKQKALKK